MKAPRRLLLGLGLPLLAIGGFWLWVYWPSGASSPRPAGAHDEANYLPSYVPSVDPPATTPPLVGGVERCDGTDAPDTAAAVNAASLSTLAWTPFGKPETGWEIYAPRIAAEIGTTCGPGSNGFASALARWQGAHGLRQTGVVDPEMFAAMLVRWHLARPFVRTNRDGICPGAPPEANLALARPEESYGGKAIRLRPGALEAYRRMLGEARAAGVLHRPDALRIFSGFRAPDADAQRCARDRNCQGLIRTICSAHRTGLAMDVVIDAAPGFGPDSSADANRLAMARSPLYRWMVVNGGRFGFVNYAYEPWHWEWTGEPLLPGVPIASLPKDGSEAFTEPPEGSTAGKPAAASGARNRR
ncbi:M15 family metallopeptidase [Caulobacter segnis]|uniref:M15 family metallopeptidase n=1 Tax=Caulobacter segnis TaxID=88688 RepID=UPI001CBA6F64|nr:M15 family metallopeptidase [Caulobacter segnis]UAL11796.1 D-alanyl-D-alanine carboxypeptidase family protein [Caulobacter segnis]